MLKASSPTSFPFVLKAKVQYDNVNENRISRKNLTPISFHIFQKQDLYLTAFV